MFNLIKASLLAIAIILAVLFAAGLTSAAPASAEIFCGERVDLIESLERSFNETPRAIGLDAGGSLIEVFVAEDGSWTILATRPGKLSCVVATGQYWESFGPREVPTREQAS